MNRLGFDCTTCHHRLTVPADRAGKAVRCPKCRAVMLVPPADGGTPVAPPDLSGAARQAAETESIFSDPADGDGESLFEDVPPRKPLLPSLPDSTQATLRVPGVPGPFTPQPVTRHATGSRTAISRLAGAPTLPVAVPAPIPPAAPADATNPFRRMVDEVMSEKTREQDEDDRHAEDEEPAPNGSAWKTWALVAVSVYALLATAAAIWGWTRTPAEPPAVVPVKK